MVQKGPKGTKMAKLGVFDHLGPFWAHLDPFGPFQTKIIFLPQMDNVGFCRGASEQNINYCLNLGSVVPLAMFSLNLAQKFTFYHFAGSFHFRKSCSYIALREHFFNFQCFKIKTESTC